MRKPLLLKLGFKISLIMCCLLIWGQGQAQSRIVTGVVKDGKSNDVLPGVNIIVKGTASGTITDANGAFSLNASESDVLVFSFIGYTKSEMQVGTNTNLQINLTPDITSLEEVVVVGYGEQKKSNVTGAISSVKAKDFEDMPNVRAEDALKGRAAGVTITATSGQPGASSSIMIRGVTSINNSDPLIVVDGTPVGGGFDYLSPNDIESIEVLKDAASAAIYGTKAASGVILITTKKGKAGTIRANFNSYFGSQQPAHKLSLLNATEYATLRNESMYAAGKTPDAPPLGVGYYSPLSPGSNPNGFFQNPSSFGKGTDWQSQVFSNSAYIQNNDLNISGGTDKSTYYASVSYLKQEGIVTPAISNYSRLTARLNSTHKVNKWLSFGQNFAYTYTKSMGVDENNYYGGVLGSAVNIDPITPTIITDPTILSQTPYSDGTYGKYVMRDPAGNPYAISTLVGQEVVNPLALLKKNRGNSYGWSDKIVGNFYLEVEPIKGLKLRTNAGADLAFWGNESFTPKFYLSATQNNTINTSFNRGMNNALNWIWTNTATYTKSIDQHNFNVTLGAEARNLGIGTNVGATYNGLPYTSLSDASMNNVNIQTLASYQAYGGEYQPYRIASLFARVNYDYSGKYLITGVVRRDGSSHFGANKKYGIFPSVSVGWVPSMENFWPSNNIVNFLKVRVGYGVNGNDNLDPFRYTSLVSTVGTYPSGGQLSAGYAPLAPANPNLHWEQTSQTNFAIDATLISNVSLSVDVFQKYTTGMLMQIQPPLFAGATQSPWGNIANMKNHGVEVTVGYRKQVGQVGINLNGNFTYVRNSVTQLDGVHEFFTYGSVIASSAEISRKAIGQPVNAFYGYQRMGLFQTQADVNKYVDKNDSPIQPNAKPGDVRWADLNGDGKIDDKDRTYLGDPTPHYIFGFTATATYRNFDFKIFAQGVAGNKIYQALRRLDITTANYSTKALGRWTGPGTSNDFPRLSDSDPNGNFTNPSSFYLQNGSFLRLKTIQLGYNFPKALLSKTGIQNARLYASVNNVYTFTKYNGFDPEIGGGLFGQDHGIYPQARSYMVGFNITF